MTDILSTCERSVAVVETGGERAIRTDTLVVEAPLELRARGRPVVVVMRTPGDDHDLARGLLFGEGVIGAGDAIEIAEPAGVAPAHRGNVLEVDIDPSRFAARSLIATAGCGVCGKTAIADLELRASVVRSDLALRREVIAGLPDRLRAAQRVFQATGGLHAAGAFDAGGTLLAIREDVGRHNAVDKVVGHLLEAGGVPASDAVLCVSGRLGFEIVQKAVTAGFPVVVAVSAPSSLAVDVAERFRVTLCAFARGGRFNVYSHGSRVE